MLILYIVKITLFNKEFLWTHNSKELAMCRIASLMTRYNVMVVSEESIPVTRHHHSLHDIYYTLTVSESMGISSPT